MGCQRLLYPSVVTARPPLHESMRLNLLASRLQCTAECFRRECCTCRFSGWRRKCILPVSSILNTGSGSVQMLVFGATVLASVFLVLVQQPEQGVCHLAALSGCSVGATAACDVLRTGRSPMPLMLLRAMDFSMSHHDCLRCKPCSSAQRGRDTCGPCKTYRAEATDPTLRMICAGQFGSAACARRSCSACTASPILVLDAERSAAQR